MKTGMSWSGSPPFASPPLTRAGDSMFAAAMAFCALLHPKGVSKREVAWQNISGGRTGFTRPDDEQWQCLGEGFQ